MKLEDNKTPQSSKKVKVKGLDLQRGDSIQTQNMDENDRSGTQTSDKLTQALLGLQANLRKTPIKQPQNP